MRGVSVADLLKQKWFLLGQPWTHSDQAGFAILAGDEDPHIGVFVADMQDYSDAVDDETARAIAAHVVKLHNDSIEPAAGAQVTEEMVQRALDATVAEGETVFWSMVFGLNKDSESTRSIMAREIVRAALEAALQGNAEGG
jgi:hypothetical protein